MAYTVIWIGADGVKAIERFSSRAKAEKHATETFPSRKGNDGVLLVEVHDKLGNTILSYGGGRAPRP